jgi:hypothetical protein
LQLVKGRQTPVTCYRVMKPANDFPVSSKGTAQDSPLRGGISDVGGLPLPSRPPKRPRHMIGQAGSMGGLSRRLLIWSGGVSQPSRVHDFADKFFEDIFESDHGVGLAVVVD